MVRLAAVSILLLTMLGGAQAAGLVANPSFEQGATEEGSPVDWRLREAEGVGLRDDGGHEGGHYVRVTDTAADKGLFLESERAPARPGGTYTATVWLRSADKCSPGLYVNVYDVLGTRIANSYSRATGPTDGWVQARVTQVAPEDAWTVSLAVYAYTGDVGTFDADDAELIVEGGAEPGSAGVDRAQPGTGEAYEIGDRLELFVDDFLIEGMTGGVERRLHHPLPREVVLELNQPWEGPTSAYFVLFEDGDGVRMYYRAETPGVDGEACCLAESRDGIHFERVNAGLFEFGGSKENNIIWVGRAAHNFTPFHDPRPDVPDDERYKALGYSHHGKGLGVFASGDGLRWRELLDHAAITDGAFDSQNLAFWDAVKGRYVDFHRKGRDGVRDIATCTSEDFRTWTDVVFVEYSDTRKEHMYTNGIQPYARAPHIYLGLPARFVPDRVKHPDHPHPGVSDAILVSSRDGLHFQRWEEAYIRPAAEREVWTDRNNYPAWGMVQTAPDEISVYWTEHYRHPGMRLRRGTLRTDGFVSLHSGGRPGEALTRPLIFTGNRLVVNYATDAVGRLHFELCGVDGSPIEGFSLADSEMLFGNELQHAVSWDGSSDIGALAGRPVRLRVLLENADLYSIRFAAEK